MVESICQVLSTTLIHMHKDAVSRANQLFAAHSLTKMICESVHPKNASLYGNEQANSTRVPKTSGNYQHTGTASSPLVINRTKRYR